MRNRRRVTSEWVWNNHYNDRSRPMRDLESIGHGIDVFELKLYPMLESGGYDFENGCPLDEADDLSKLSRIDKEHLEFIRVHRTKVMDQ